MNPVVAEMEVIMPEEISASKNELPVKLFLHGVRLCYNDQLVQIFC